MDDEQAVAMLKGIVGDRGELIYAQKSGSWAFNLNTPTSDVDYFGVFIAPDPLDIKTHSFDHTVQGNSGDDWVLYELGKYIELLAKGNPKVIEPLFSPTFLYRTDKWLQLVAHFKPRVINKFSARQYVSFASFELHEAKKKSSAESDPSKALSAASKPLYHGLRLAKEARAIIEGRGPRVYWTGDEREELMAIRTGKSGATLESLMERVQIEISDLKSANEASQTIPEKIDMEELGRWIVEERLVALRAIKSKEAPVSIIPAVSSCAEVGGSADPDASSGPDGHEAKPDRCQDMASHSLPKSPEVAEAGLVTPPSELPSVLAAASQVSLPAWVRPIIDRTHPLLKSHGIHGATALCVCQIGTHLLLAISGKASSLVSATPTTSTAPDHLVVYRQNVDEILNPVLDVPTFIFEHPVEKHGRGIWCIELATALNLLSRNHVVFESLAALPNDERCHEGLVWNHSSWEPFQLVIRQMWMESQIVTFGLVSHYLGSATGLLKSTSIWPNSNKAAATNPTSAPTEPTTAGTVADLSGSREETQSKAYALARRLVLQAMRLIPSSEPSQVHLLSSEECQEILKLRVGGNEGNSDEERQEPPADFARLKDDLLLLIMDVQARLKSKKMATDLPGKVKQQLAALVRQARYETLR
jgi:hypothetical protein